MAQQAAEATLSLVLALPQAKSPDGNGTMCWEKSSQNVCQLGQRKLLQKSRRSKKKTNRKIGRNADMEIRALTPAEQKYTYMLMSRCGMDTEAVFEREDFAEIINFNTPATINALAAHRYACRS